MCGCNKEGMRGRGGGRGRDVRDRGGDRIGEERRGGDRGEGGGGW